MFQNKDVWAGLIVFLIGAALIVYLIPQGIDEPKKVKFAVMSPSYYPRIVAIAMALIGVAIAVGAATNKSTDSLFAGLDTQSIIKVGTVAIIFLATAYALPHAGFVLTCTVALVALMLLAGERNPLIIAPIALILPFGLHLFFTKIANVPIPAGVLETYLQRI